MPPPPPSHGYWAQPPRPPSGAYYGSYPGGGDFHPPSQYGQNTSGQVGIVYVTCQLTYYLTLHPVLTQN